MIDNKNLKNKHMKKIVLGSALLAIIIIMMSGCLTVEQKEYTFEFTGKNSGVLIIKYINIYSEMDDSVDVSEVDFDQLINKYLNGHEIENLYPAATNVRKRIFEENGRLCGEVKMDFNDITAVKLFQLNKKSPIMFNISGLIDTESFVESNGTYGGENMPVVFWDKKLKKLTLTTSLGSPNESSISLLKNYKWWK